MYNYQIGTLYNFTTLAPSILGAQLQNAKLLSIMQYDMAKLFANIDQQAQIILPLLPSGTPTDPTSYTYLMFQSSTGENVLLANVWINEASIVVATPTTIQVVITGVTLSDVTVVRDILNQMGYTQLTITTS